MRCLAIVRDLLAGAAVTFHGEFFDLNDALIVPVPAEPVPIIVGGRSDAAIRRAGRFGDGWLGIWNSPRRFAEAVRLAADEAAKAGRATPPSRHGMQVWCGFAETKEAARACLGAGHARVLPAAVRAVRTLLPVRNPRGRSRVPRALRSGRMRGSST